MPRPRTLFPVVLLIAALLSAACGDDDSQTPTAPTSPAETTETFDGTVTVNGAVIHSFNVQRAGTVTVRVAALEPDNEAVLGLSLGTWNGLTCTLVVVSTTATLNTTVTGTASTSGNFCAYVQDVGKITAAASYQIVVTHF